MYICIYIYINIALRNALCLISSASDNSRFVYTNLYCFCYTVLQVYLEFNNHWQTSLHKHFHNIFRVSIRIKLKTFAHLKIHVQLLGMKTSQKSSRTGGQLILAKYSMQYKLTITPLPTLKLNHRKTFPAVFNTNTTVRPITPKRINITG